MSDDVSNDEVAQLGNSDHGSQITSPQDLFAETVEIEPVEIDKALPLLWETESRSNSVISPDIGETTNLPIISLNAILEPLRWLTRAPGWSRRKDDQSFICFYRKDAEGSFQNICSLTPARFEKKFELVRQELLTESLMSINGFYTAAASRNHRIGLPYAVRGEKHLRWLQACAVDLDCGRQHGNAAQCLPLAEVEAALSNMICRGDLPLPSMRVRSGRGIWLLWLLYDGCHIDAPVRAYWANRVLYSHVERAIVSRLAHLGADPSAIDGSRLIRVPGSYNTLARRIVKYEIGKLHGGSPPFYTLQQLARSFGVSTHLIHVNDHTLNAGAASPQAPADPCLSRDELRGKPATLEIVKSTGLWGIRRQTINRGIAPARAKGPRTRDRFRARDLECIESCHGGWVKGTRKYHLWLYAGFLRGAGLRPAETLAAVAKMANRCHPPYPSDANDTCLEKLIKDVFEQPLAVPSTQKLCKNLNVTADEARNLNLHVIAPAEVRSERRQPPGGQRRAQQCVRRQELRDVVTKEGLKSSRILAQVLRSKGIKVSDWTVNNDLKALGYDPSSSPERCPGRPPR